MKNLTTWSLIMTLLSQGSSALGSPNDHPMSLVEAREYMLSLVNRDRMANHLPKLLMDTTASAAGQIHSDEMAQKGYISHWDTSGKKPIQRYTEAGGSDHVSENLCLVSTRVFSTEALAKQSKPTHLFSKDELNDLEKSFMTETPPNDGHRVQILTPEHNKVGFGLSFFVNAQNDGHLAIAQEFLNAYGRYSKLPSSIVRGRVFQVSGTFSPGVNFYSLSIYREPMPKSISKADLNNGPRELAYSDNAIVTYFPTDKNVKTAMVKGAQCFSVQITPDRDWQSGLYYVSVCAVKLKRNDVIEVSTRTTSLN
ncbi:MAG: CAP domain-containing protein [Candidatus Melainabacteria bacterium]|nr:MAG: CAP domain-containing protein [Candidatus Melainabacteria bacterium]